MGAQATKTDRLTPAEEKIIVKTWNKVMERRADFAIDMGVNLFTRSPEIHQLFKLLRDIPVDELRGDPRMKAHCLRAVGAMSALVNELDDENDDDVLAEMFKNVARTHHGYRVGKAHFDSFGEVVLEEFQRHLQGDFGEVEVNAWLKAYASMVNAILETYKEIEREPLQG